LLLEQPGPWGRDAILESRLDPELGAELTGRAAGTGVRVALIRHPADSHEHTPRHRRWYAASTHPDRTWLATGLVEFPTELLRVDFAALDAGSVSAVADLPHEMIASPLLGICTNSKRDQCCATRGRPVAVAAYTADASSGPEDALPGVWEITHLGGHRFSPTAVLLPHGYVYGRLNVAQATQILADARRERVLLDGCRGRSTWSSAGQAAELAVRTEIGERGLSALRVASQEQTAPEPTPAWRVVVEHGDGRAFEVSVSGAHAPIPRPESCGKADGSPLELRVASIDKIR
jgi:hypothetical protein